MQLLKTNPVKARKINLSVMNDNESTCKTYYAVDSKKKVERRDIKSIILWARNIWSPVKHPVRQ
jgi:hypothetical protein